MFEVHKRDKDLIIDQTNLTSVQIVAGTCHFTRPQEGSKTESEHGTKENSLVWIKSHSVKGQ